MKANASGLAAFWCLVFTLRSPAATTHYVNLNNPSPSAPYTTWATAATNIQDAVDAATNGDLVLVTNGLYQTGGRTVPGQSMVNRLTVTNPITVQSVNGPAVTVIKGGLSAGPATGRCAYLAGGAVLSGFTLTAGIVNTNGLDPSFFPGATNADYYGGGVLCADTNESVSNCMIIGNAASYGGGIFSGTVKNCQIFSNVTPAVSTYPQGFIPFVGGGSCNSLLDQCLLSGNISSYGGGASGGSLTGCLVVSNKAVIGAGVEQSTLINCTVANNSDIVSNTGAGTAFCTVRNSIVYGNTNGTDDSGSTFSYACTPATHSGAGNITNSPLFIDAANGNFRLQSNSPCINAGNNAYAPLGTDLDGNTRIAGGTVDMGAYEFPLPIIHYVNLSSPGPVAPYTTWATAATNIQDAVDTATAGDTILVTNGVYQTGGRVFSTSTVTNRVVVDKAVTVQSVNGPLVTIIRGYQMPVTTNGPGAVRCIYLADGAVLAGFTLTNGATLAGGNDVQEGGDTSGGGILCPSASVTVSNCILAGNAAGDFGGGADRGTFYNCLFWANWATLGVGSYGGASLDGRLYNCTLVGNQADSGGGLAFGSANNCIIYYNGDVGNDSSFVAPDHTCTPADPGGIGNITNDPAFIDLPGGNFHLQSNSPCINAGNNLYPAGPDLGGNPRISGGTVDIGAYEFQNPTSTISYAWLQQFGLPTDGSADNIDSDSDGMSNWQEWRAGTDPTDPSSALTLLSPAPSDQDIIITWQSVQNVNYYLQRTATLTPGSFQTIATNLPGQPGTASYTDTNAAPGPWFYRIGVQ